MCVCDCVYHICVCVCVHVYLDKSVLSPSDVVGPIRGNVHGIDGTSLGSLQLSEGRSILDLPVADLVVATAGQDVHPLGSKAHALEERVGQHNLTPCVCPAKGAMGSDQWGRTRS